MVLAPIVKLKLSSWNGEAIKTVVVVAGTSRLMVYSTRHGRLALVLKGFNAMVTKDLIKQIRSHKGAIYIGTNNGDDMMYVQVVKSDLINTISRQFDSEAETGFELENGYLSIDYNVNY
jgi:hypothetical protein